MNIAIGIGANLGDRLATIREAERRIEGIATMVLARSRVYETSAIGAPTPQPDFLNVAIAIDWSDSPLKLLDALMEIETSLGRVRTSGERNEARVIDLDILWIDGGITIDDPPRLIVPHPRLHERAFAILPLLDVAPHALNPRTGARYAAPSDQIVRVMARS